MLENESRFFSQSPASLIKLLTILLVITLGVSTKAAAQPGNQSQRPLPLPARGANDIDNQFRIMQQLQRMVQSGESALPNDAATDPSSADRAWLDALRETAENAGFGGTGGDANEDQSGWLNPKNWEEMAKNLTPEQRDAARELAQQFQSEMKESGQQPQTPAQMEGLLKDFLRDRKLPDFAPGSGPSLPGLPPTPPANRKPADQDQPLQPNSIPERNDQLGPQNDQQRDTQRANQRRNEERAERGNESAGDASRRNQDRPLNQDPLLNQENPFRSTDPAELDPAGDATNRSQQSPSSTQQLLERLMREPSSLPPLAPPPHAESGSLERTPASSANTGSDRSPQSARQAAIERQNQAVRSGGLPSSSPRSNGLSDNEGVTGEAGERGETATGTIDPETAEKLRKTVQQRGLGEALRDIFRETNQEAKDEAARAAQEAREKAIAAAMEKALADMQSPDAQNQTVEGGPSNAGGANADDGIGLPQRADSPDISAGPKRRRGYSWGPKPPRPTNPTDSGSSMLEGLVDKEMIDSLLGDQKELERMIRELQKRTAEAVAEEKSLSPALQRAAEQQRLSQRSESQRNSEQNGQTANRSGSSPQPFDMDPLGIDKPNGNATKRASEDKSASLTNRLANWYKSLTSANDDGGSGGSQNNSTAANSNSENGDSTSSVGANDLPFSWSGVPLILFAIAAAAIGFWWFRRKQHVDATAKRQAIYARLMPSTIHSKDDVIKAFHCIALASRNAPPLWWPHPKTAKSLASTNPNSGSAVFTLAQLYEIARYSPNGAKLTTDQLTQANQALVHLKDL